MNIPEYKTTTIEKQRFILLHYGLLKTIWDWIILIVTFYVAIVVPYNATFKPKQSEQTINSPTINFTSNSTTSGNSTQTGNNNSDECKVDTMDMIVEAIFLIDVCLNLRTTYVNRKGEVVTKPKVSLSIESRCFCFQSSSLTHHRTNQCVTYQLDDHASLSENLVHRRHLRCLANRRALWSSKFKPTHHSSSYATNPNQQDRLTKIPTLRMLSFNRGLI